MKAAPHSDYTRQSIPLNVNFGVWWIPSEYSDTVWDMYMTSVSVVLSSLSVFKEQIVFSETFSYPILVWESMEKLDTYSHF